MISWRFCVYLIRVLRKLQKVMRTLLLIFIGFSFVGFIFGLAGKSAAVKKKSLKKSEFYNRLTILFLILMIVFAITYSFVN